MPTSYFIPAGTTSSSTSLGLTSWIITPPPPPNYGIFISAQYQQWDSFWDNTNQVKALFTDMNLTWEEVEVSLP
jgi:hypothetical protein